MKRLLSWMYRVLFPRWDSMKMDRIRGAKTPDFLENYYKELDE